jgi:hypothetical protein
MLNPSVRSQYLPRSSRVRYFFLNLNKIGRILMVLTMVYNNQNHWLGGLCQSPGILANYAQCLTIHLSMGPNSVSLSPHPKRETDPVTETSFVLVL